jgi:putative membrane protein
MLFLTRIEADAIEARTAALEAHAGVQVVTAVVGKADHYSELPWKAFALGAVLAALAVVIADWLRPDWVGAHVALLHVLTILGVGVVSALLAIYVPAYARVFLTTLRRDSEVRHYAESMFLRRELFNTRDRNGILVLVCLFEHKVEILADTGLHGRVGEPQWRSVIARMAPALRAGRIAEALLQGLARLDEILREKGPEPQADTTNELRDRPIEERGAR